jgi:uncharacterized protein
MSKRCSVACDTPDGILLCELDLPEEATIAVALSHAKRVLGDAAADWEHAATGIYGRAYPREHVPVHGDRIELYRPLRLDPREKRRARAAAAAKPHQPGGRGPRRG